MNTTGLGSTSISCLGIDWQTVPLPEEPLWRGDDAELASVTLGHIASVYGDIYEAEGLLWVYHPAGPYAGTWRPIHPDAFNVLLQRFAGTLKVIIPGDEGDAPKYRPIKVTRPLVDNVYKLATALARVRTLEMFGAGGMFANAPPCLVERDGAYIVQWDGLRFVSHSAEHRARHKVDVATKEYGFSGWIGSRWDAFLEQTLGSSTSQEAFLLRDFIGACLFGMAPSFQKALMLVGSGANGKSVFLDAVSALFPKGAIVSIAPQDLGDDSKGAALAEALVNIVSETPDRRLLHSDTFKAVIAGDNITRRQLYQTPITFRPKAGHIFAANRLPLSTDTTDGFWRRWLVVQFGRTFPVAEQNPNLARELTAEVEQLAIVLWALDGAHNLFKAGGYTVPESSKRLTDEWRSDSNPVELWLGECCELGRGWSPSAHCYQDYRRWCKASGFEPLNIKNFGTRMVEAGVSKRRLSAGVQYGVQVFLDGSLDAAKARGYADA
jgi:P4 family phage/plasmid primase-like protien